MKVKNEYLVIANNILGANAGGLMNDKSGKVKSVYNGYIGSFGGSVVQPGLLPTVMVYEADAEKKKISNLIFKIYAKAKDETYRENGFKDYLLKNNNYKSRSIRNNIAQSLIALKLVLRTFEFDKENENENN